jgi:chromosome segregation ATPase
LSRFADKSAQAASDAGVADLQNQMAELKRKYETCMQQRLLEEIQTKGGPKAELDLKKIRAEIYQLEGRLEQATERQIQMEKELRDFRRDFGSAARHFFDLKAKLSVL